MKRPPITYLADNEDGVVWVGRDGVSAHRARREVAGLVGAKPWPWRFAVSATFMRPFDQSDCEAAAHGRDSDGEPLDDDCRCSWQEEEGWMYQCGPDHPAAVAAWRVEDDAMGPMWLWRLRDRRAELYRAMRHEGRPVLWGGSPERRVNRLDRLIAGKAIAVVLLRSHQLRVGEAEWRWCVVCEGVRRHWQPQRPGYLPRCEGDEHFGRLWARDEALR